MYKLQQITNIYRDKCDKYVQRKMTQCLLCGNYVISLPQHVYGEHRKTMSYYNVMTRDKGSTNTYIRRKNIWQ
jgi:ribosomal protein S27AE